MFSAFSTEEDPLFHTFRIQPDEALDQTAAADLSRFKFAPPGHELFIASSADVSATTSPEFSPVFAAQQQQLLQQQLQQPRVSPTAAAQRGVDNLAIRLPAPEPTKVSPNAVIDLKAGVPLIPIASSSAMTLEDMLVAQREAGIVEVAAYSDIVAWYSLRNPEGLKALRAAEDHSRASHRGNNNNSSNEDQMFLGQLPMFMTSDCLAMTLDFVLDYPGAVRRVMLRADHASGHAPYALVQVRSEVRDVFLSLDRRVYFGRTHAFFTRTTTNAPVFQRIVARVLGVDAERPSANRDYQYARSAMVASHAKHSNQGASKGAASSRGALPSPPASFPTRGHAAPQPLPPPPPPQYQMPPVAWQPAQPQPQLQPQHQPQQQQGVMMVPYHPSSFVTPQHHHAIAYAPPPLQQQQQPMTQQHHTVVYAAPNQQQQQQAWTYAQPQPGSAVYSQPGHAAVVMPPHQFFAPVAAPHPSMMPPAQAHYF